MENKTYIAIDLKSFYASVECIERGLDPLKDCLVVADAARTKKTICLAVSPALKAYGISGRARLFEAYQQVELENANRLRKAPNHKFTGSSANATTLATHPELALDFVIAPPRMAHYIEYSTRIYNIYLKYVFLINLSSKQLSRFFDACRQRRRDFGVNLATFKHPETIICNFSSSHDVLAFIAENKEIVFNLPQGLVSF